jgi:hypothetical protein
MTGGATRKLSARTSVVAPGATSETLEFADPVKWTQTAFVATPEVNVQLVSWQDDAKWLGLVVAPPDVQSTSAPGPAFSVTGSELDVVVAAEVSVMVTAFGAPGVPAASCMAHGWASSLGTEMSGAVWETHRPETSHVVFAAVHGCVAEQSLVHVCVDVWQYCPSPQSSAK